MAFMNREAIERMGFKYVGQNVQLSDKASYYNCGQISIGDNTRIDDFCVISAGKGGVEIGIHAHIAVGVLLIGAGKIKVGDFSGISSRTAVYSSSDDYSGAFMTNPTLPVELTNVHHGDVVLGKHVIVGAGCVILPEVEIPDGVAVGALSLVNRDCEEFGIYMGVPAKKIKMRKRDLLEVERRFRTLRNR